MKEELRGRLQRNLLELKNTDLVDGTDEFLKDCDITQADSERVRNETTTEEKNRKLVTILMTKGDDVFPKILNWLTKAGHKGLVNSLAEGGAEEYDLAEIKQRGAAFKQPMISAPESHSNLNIHLHINSVNSVHIQDNKNNNSSRNTSSSSSKSGCKTSKEKSSSLLRKKQNSKKSPVKRLTNNGPSQQCKTRRRVPALGKTGKGRNMKSPRTKNKMCNCGVKAALRTVKKESCNKGRDFYTCETSGCKYFEWAVQMTPNSKPRAGSKKPSPSQTKVNSVTSSAAKDRRFLCNCKQEANRLQVSKEGPNKGRWFYRCSLPEGKQCRYFEWADEVKVKKRKCGCCNEEGHMKKTCPHNGP